MYFLLALAIAAWFLLGDPPKTIANIFWSNGPAPWETVDAFYYPDANDLTQHQVTYGLDSLAACRGWAMGMAVANNDPWLERSDYECGFGFTGMLGDLRVYRNTAE